MITLYLLFFLMLIFAIILLGWPFIKNRLMARFFILMGFMILIPFSLYLFSSKPAALKWWLTQGQDHYQLLEKFDELGGLDGVIAHIEQRLKENPHDARGWMILGKLYLAKHKEEKANEAFKKANELN